MIGSSALIYEKREFSAQNGGFRHELPVRRPGANRTVANAFVGDRLIDYCPCSLDPARDRFCEDDNIIVLASWPLQFTICD